MKKTALQKMLDNIRKKRLSLARRELARRLPDARHEIMAGDYDQGMAMQQVIQELREINAYSAS